MTKKKKTTRKKISVKDLKDLKGGKAACCYEKDEYEQIEETANGKAGTQTQVKEGRSCDYSAA